MLKLLGYIVILFVVLLGTSCVNHKQLSTFYGVDFPVDSLENIVNRLPVTIQPQDLLNVSLTSFDDELVKAFNPQNNQNFNMNSFRSQSNESSNSFEYFSGYLVDDEGFVDFPVIGKVKLSGLTRREAKELLLEKISVYSKDANINVRFLNFKITVLGEVSTPGPQRISNERYTVLEALGAAGDFTNYAQRDQVLVVREKEGKRGFTLLNLQDKNVFKSPYFYLQQNDVVFVYPTQNKTATVADPFQRYISIGSGLLSIIAVIITLTR